MYLILEMLKNNIIKPLILFLLLSQFATLAHAIEHQLGQAEHEQCLICRHDTDSKNLLIDTTNVINFDFFSYEKIIFTTHTFYLTTQSLYNIRSPPIFLA
jgi:hypothetical protein